MIIQKCDAIQRPKLIHLCGAPSLRSKAFLPALSCLRCSGLLVLLRTTAHSLICQLNTLPPDYTAGVGAWGVSVAVRCFRACRAFGQQLDSRSCPSPRGQQQANRRNITHTADPRSSFREGSLRSLVRLKGAGLPPSNHFAAPMPISWSLGLYQFEVGKYSVLEVPESRLTWGFWNQHPIATKNGSLGSCALVLAVGGVAPRHISISVADTDAGVSCRSQSAAACPLPLTLGTHSSPGPPGVP